MRQPITSPEHCCCPYARSRLTPPYSRAPPRGPAPKARHLDLQHYHPTVPGSFRLATLSTEPFRELSQHRQTGACVPRRRGDRIPGQRGNRDLFRT